MNYNRFGKIVILNDRNDTFSTKDDNFFIPGLGECIVSEFKNNILTVISEKIVNDTNVFKFELVTETVTMLKRVE